MMTKNRIAFPNASSNIKLHSAGIIIKKNIKFTRTGKVGSKRGAIGGFSYQARQRLRRHLLVSGLSVPFAQFGVTLTVPGKVTPDAVDRFKEHADRFFHGVKYIYPSHAIIYRVELQRRKMPHLHLVVYVPIAELQERFPDWQAVFNKDKEGFHYLFEIAFNGYKKAWFKSLESWEERHLIFGGSTHAVKFTSLETASSIRYLCDHQSKAKVAQLGYPGKQWGIVGKKNLVEMEALQDLDLTGSQTSAFLRVLARLKAGTVKAPGKPFGRKVSRNKRYRRGGVLYSSFETVKRLALWAVDEYPAPVTPEKFNPDALPD